MSSLIPTLPLPTSLLGSVPSPPNMSEEDSLLSRLDITLEIIEKEYETYNLQFSNRKQKRVVPSLFYSFYRSQLCSNFIMACYHYLVQYIRSPVQSGERMDGSGPDSSRGPMHDSNLNGKKIKALQFALQRVAQCWSGVLMYRSEMNRFETITVSRTSKKSEHFLNDTYDHFFFETLYLLVEYIIEARFLDQTRPLLSNSNTNSAVAVRATSSSLSPSHTDTISPVNMNVDGSVIPSNPSGVVSPPNNTTNSSSSKGTKSSTASAAILAQQIEAQWRTAQHELQRILRSRNFFAATRKRTSSSSNTTSADGNGNSGNGLNHVPLSTSALQSTTATPGGGNGQHGASSSARRGGKSIGSTGANGVAATASYRSPSTFRLSGQGPIPPPRAWDDTDPAEEVYAEESRALSHLPGYFKSKGSFGILDCLDLRSPIIASVLPNPRTMRSTNESYVFGSEPRRGGIGPNGLPRTHARLTHAEEKYLTEQHALQTVRALQYKLKLEREEREAQEREIQMMEEEEQRRRKEAEDAERLTSEMESNHLNGFDSLKESTATTEESKQQSDIPTLNRSGTLVPALRLPLGLKPTSVARVPSRTFISPSSINSSVSNNSSIFSASASANLIGNNTSGLIASASAATTHRTFRQAHPPTTGNRSGSLSARSSGGGIDQSNNNRFHSYNFPGAPPLPLSHRNRLTLDEALATKAVPLIQINRKGRIELSDFRIR
jgi:hypothetical protein